MRAGGVNSVEVAGLLLRLLTDAGGPMRLAELSARRRHALGQGPPVLVSLGRAGLVEQDPTTARYELGPLMLRAPRRIGPVRHAEAGGAGIGAIVARTGETAAVAVWGTHRQAHVGLVAARHALAASVPPGHVCPMTYSASGLVFCAFGDPALTRRSRRVAAPSARRPARRAERHRAT